MINKKGQFIKGNIPWNLGKEHSTETKAKIGAINRGRKLSEETKRKIGLNGFHYGMKGKHHSKETREKMSDARSGEKNPMFGKKMSIELRSKLSEARKRFYQNGGVHPKGMLNKIATEETKKKMSEAHSGEKFWNWKGGYRHKLWLNRQRKFMKKANGGKHTHEQWEDLKKFFDYMCLCCKRTEPTIKLTEDHILPISKGGSNDISNIQPLCFDCNRIKWTQIIDYKTKIFNSILEASGLDSINYSDLEKPVPQQVVPAAQPQLTPTQ